MKNFLKLMVLTLIMLMSVSLWAHSQEAGLTDEEKAMITDNVIVPSPSDLFLALDKMGDVNWSEAASYTTQFSYKNNYLRALNLGVRGAEGFVALQAKDKNNLANMISTIIRIAEDLGASDTILRKRQTFENLTQREQWFELRGELDKIRDDILLELVNQGDTDVALLLSIGGWIEGLQMTTKILSKDYNEDTSTILYQPILVEYFEKKCNELGSRAKRQKAVKDIIEKIPEIKTLIDVGYDNSISEDSVKKLHAISYQLVSAIQGGE